MYTACRVCGVRIASEMIEGIEAFTCPVCHYTQEVQRGDEETGQKRRGSSRCPQCGRSWGQGEGSWKVPTLVVSGELEQDEVASEPVLGVANSREDPHGCTDGEAGGALVIIKELTKEYSGKFVKENELEILLDNEDGTGTWYQKALIEGLHHNPMTDVVTFRGTKLSAIRNVRLK